MSEDTLNDLLDRWQEAFAAGRDTPVDDLCPDHPDLAAELRRRITMLRRFHALADLPAEGGSAPATVHASRSDTPQPLMVGGVEVAGPSVRVGQDLAGFRLLRLLGEGGMGQVFEAEELALRRRVALKVMHSHLACRPEARDRFLAEAWAMAAVQHDHVVPIFRVDAASGMPFLAMPLLAGETLSIRMLRSGPFPVAVAVRIAREAAQGLAAAHARGLIHRDVKPGNLWLEAPNDRVKVLDFGLARAAHGAEGLTHPGALLGTPGYMSPEQIDGLKLDLRTDLFSLGCVLYQMLTGRPAFDGNTAVARAMSVKEQHPPPPAVLNPAVPAALSDLVTRLLAKDRSVRPASTDDLVAELTSLETSLSSEAGRDPVASSPPSLTARHSPLASRWKWLLPAGVVLLAAVVGGGLLSRSWMRPAVSTPEPTTIPERIEGARTASPSYKGSVDLLVQWQNPDDANSNFTVSLSDPRAMPLRPGRLFKIVAEVEPAAYLYLFWIDEKGETLPVYPWVPSKWGTRPAEEKPAGRLEIKSPDGKYLQVTGDGAGMETILLLARPDKLDKSEEEVRRWFAGLVPLPLRGERSRVWFENFDLVRNDVTRGFSYAADLNKPDTPLAQQIELGRRIGKAAAFARAISFARLGKDK
jgi:serine/threonine protein kinase